MKTYNYTWPEQESFASSYACRFLPRRGMAKTQNYLLGPIFNLLDFSKTSSLVVSWSILLGLWVIIYYVLPIGFWNSEDKQYVNVTRSIIYTILAYFAVSFFLISSLMKKGCAALEDQADAFLYGEAPSLPPTLE